MKAGTLRYWRSTGQGPAWFRLGPRKIAYRRSDVERWIREQFDRSPTPIPPVPPDRFPVPAIPSHRRGAKPAPTPNQKAWRNPSGPAPSRTAHRPLEERLPSKCTPTMGRPPRSRSGLERCAGSGPPARLGLACTPRDIRTSPRPGLRPAGRHREPHSPVRPNPIGCCTGCRRCSRPGRPGGPSSSTQGEKDCDALAGFPSAIPPTNRGGYTVTDLVDLRQRRRSVSAPVTSGRIDRLVRGHPSCDHRRQTRAARREPAYRRMPLGLVLEDRVIDAAVRLLDVSSWTASSKSPPGDALAGRHAGRSRSEPPTTPRRRSR